MRLKIPIDKVARMPHPKKIAIFGVLDQFQEEISYKAYQSLVEELKNGEKSNFAVLVDVASVHRPFCEWIMRNGEHEAYALCEIVKFSHVDGKTFLISDSACDEIARMEPDVEPTLMGLDVPFRSIYLAFGTNAHSSPIFMRNNGSQMRFEGMYLSVVNATNERDGRLPERILRCFHTVPDLPYKVIEACFVGSPIVDGIVRAERSIVFGSQTLRLFNENITLADAMSQSHDMQNHINSLLLTTIRSFHGQLVDIEGEVGVYDANEERYIRSMKLAIKALSYIRSGHGSSTEICREKALEDRARRTKGYAKRRVVQELLTTYDHILVTPKGTTHMASSTTH